MAAGSCSVTAPSFFAVPITGKVRAAGAVRQLVIVQDRLIEDLPAELWPDRPLVQGNSSKTAVPEFLGSTEVSFRFSPARYLRFRSRALTASRAVQDAGTHDAHPPDRQRVGAADVLGDEAPAIAETLLHPAVKCRVKPVVTGV